MLSQRAKYALKAMLDLAGAPPGQPVQIADIAERQAIPKRFLEQIMLDLKRAGWVDSRRGKQGGYLLVMLPALITIGAIVRQVDGPMAPLSCLSHTAYRRCVDCADESRCAIRRAFAPVHQAQLAVLDHMSVADLQTVPEP
jgi:Rrf2 family protein